MGRRVYSSRSAGYRMSNVKHQHQSRREMSGGRDKVVKHKGQANTEEQKTRSKMSLSLPFFMYLPGRKDKSGVHEKKKGTRNPPWLQVVQVVVNSFRKRCQRSQEKCWSSEMVAS